MSRAGGLLALAALGACVGSIDRSPAVGRGPGGNAGSGGASRSGGTSGARSGGAGGGAGGEAGAPYSPGDLSSLDVFTRLRVTCLPCHRAQDERPYFATIENFDNQIAYDPRWVIPGDPARSNLPGLLRGSIGKQMPPAPGESFQQIERGGKAAITLVEIEQWIRLLRPRAAPGPIEVSLMRRKTAEQVVATLYDQLGLDEADFYRPTLAPVAADAYAVRSPDRVPYASSLEQGGTLFLALGGPYWLDGRARNDTVTPSFTQALTHVSQAWCRTAFQKAGNTAVLARASLGDTSAAAAASVRANIAYLYLRMLGQDPPPTEIDDLFDSVFRKYESKGALTAWTAVCAALVRDPLWITY